MKSAEIRQQFLDFFNEKQHQIVPSAPMVVKDDPTLMFTNAGMNQFKEFFLGNKTPKNVCVFRESTTTWKKLELIPITIPFSKCWGTGVLAIILKKKPLHGLGNC